MNKTKKWLLLLLVAVVGTSALQAQVSIGSKKKPYDFSVLEVSTAIAKGGLRLPRLTTAERNALNLTTDASAVPDSVAGLLIYNLDVNCLEYWNKTKWVSLCSGTSTVDLSGDNGSGSPVNPFDPGYPGTNDPDDPISPVFPEEGGVKGDYIPGDNPACATATPPYKIAVISGNTYASVKITDPATGKFKVTMTANNTVDTRYAVVRVTNNCTKEYKDFLYSQEGQTIGVYPDPTQPDVPSDGGQKGPFIPEINPEVCATPGTYTVTANQSWCHVTCDATTGKFSLQFDANNSVTPRPVLITVDNNGCDGQTTTYTVYQEGKTSGLDTDGNPGTPNDPTQPPVAPEGGDTPDATPEGNPTCSTSVQNPAYTITLVSGTAYAGLNIKDVSTGKFSVHFNENNTIYERYAVVRVKDNCTNVFADYTFSQLGQGIGVSPEPTQEVGAEGGQKGPYIPAVDPAKCATPVYLVTSSQPTWCKPAITNPSTGSFVVVYEPNYQATARTAVITVKASNCSNTEASYTVSQQGANVEIGVGNYPVGEVLPAGGQTPAGSPNSSPRCSQSPSYTVALTNGEAYATLVVEDAMTGTFHVEFSANTTLVRRSATVRVTNPCNGLFSDFIYYQSPMDCATQNITGSNLTQSKESGQAISEVVFTSSSPISVTGSATGIVISRNNTTSVSITGTPTLVGNYTFVATTNASCSQGRKVFELSVVTPACVNPTDPSTTGVTLCGSQPATLSASGAGVGEEYRWYDAQTGGNYLGATSTGSYTTPTSVPTTTTYYVSKINTTTGCESNRVAVTVTVAPPPTLALTSGTQNPTVSCGTAITAIKFTGGGGATGVSISDLSGTGLSSSVSGNVITISGTPTQTVNYTVTTTGQNASCTAATQTGTITSTAITQPTGVTTPQLPCTPGSTVGDLTPAPSTTRAWFSQATGGTELAGTTTLQAGTNTYYVAAKNAAGCYSNRVAVSVTATAAWTMATTGSANTVTDVRDGQVYRTKVFGTAGEWMVENLRYIPQGGNEGTWSYTNSTSVPYYNYPNASSTTETTEAAAKAKAFDVHKEYGVLYNWSSATKNAFGSGTNTADNVTTTAPNNYGKVSSNVQGICPAGWVLPSDKDWTDLEKAIIADPGSYSLNTTVETWPTDAEKRTTYSSTKQGEEMKSTMCVNSTNPNGKSKTDGSGFNGLLVGYMYSGSPYNYGTSTYYWSSSSNSTSNAWYRSLNYSNTGVNRNYYFRNYLFSVRCKKQ